MRDRVSVWEYCVWVRARERVYERVGLCVHGFVHEKQWVYVSVCMPKCVLVYLHAFMYTCEQCIVFGLENNSTQKWWMLIKQHSYSVCQWGKSCEVLFSLQSPYSRKWHGILRQYWRYDWSNSIDFLFIVFNFHSRRTLENLTHYKCCSCNPLDILLKAA